MKPAILIALAGTSSEDGAKTLTHIDNLLRDRFQGIRRSWAYTSSGVRRKLEQSGKPVASPSEALADLIKDGVTHVAVKSLHMATGMEYTDLKDLVQKFNGGSSGFKNIILSKPLWDVPADFERTVQRLLSDLPAGTNASEAVLLVAHGSQRREAQGTYEAAAAICRRLDRRVILSTLMSNPSLEDVIRECKASGLKNLVLVPLMIVAGSSVTNDLAGDGPGSWVSVLGREGIRCTPVIKGLADHDEIIRIWMDDVGRMLTELA